MKKSLVFLIVSGVFRILMGIYDIIDLHVTTHSYKNPYTWIILENLNLASQIVLAIAITIFAISAFIKILNKKGE